MIKVTLLIFCTALVCGCGPKMYDNSDPMADWNRDSFQCQKYAEDNTPMPQHTPTPQARTESGYGTAYTNAGPVPFTYTQTYRPDPYEQASANLYNASASWGRIATVMSRYENCLNSLGWYEVKKDKKENIAIDDRSIVDAHRDIYLGSKIIGNNIIEITVSDGFKYKSKEQKEQFIFDILAAYNIDEQLYICRANGKKYSGRAIEEKSRSMLAYFDRKYGIVFYDD